MAKESASVGGSAGRVPNGCDLMDRWPPETGPGWPDTDLIGASSAFTVPG